MVTLVVYRQIATLPGLVRAHRALKGRRFASAFDHFVTTHRAFPSITLSAKLAPKLSLLLVRNAHIYNTKITGLRQYLERIRKYHLTGRRTRTTTIVVSAIVAVTVPSVAGASARQNYTASRRGCSGRRRRATSLTGLLLLWLLLLVLVLLLLLLAIRS